MTISSIYSTSILFGVQHKQILAIHLIISAYVESEAVAVDTASKLQNTWNWIHG